MRFFFPAGLATLAVVGLTAVLAVMPWNGSGTAFADPSSMTWEVTFDGTSATSSGNGDNVVEVGESLDTITTVSLDTTPPPPTDEPFFDLADMLFSGLMPAYAAAVADGALIGTMTFSIESNLVNPANSNIDPITGQPPACVAGAAALNATFSIFDADLGTAADADVHDLGAGLISEQDLDSDGLRETEDDNFSADGSSGSNGLADGIDLLPDALANYLTPSLGLGSPISRSFGVATLSAALGVTMDVNFLLFHLGGGEYFALTILGYPGLPTQQPSAANLTSQTVITCPPFTSTVRVFGLTQDNPATTEIHEPAVSQRTARSGTHSYEILVSTRDNYDGDAAAAPYDSCPAAVSVNTDLPPAGSVDPDSDRWDSACDPYPGSPDNDHDSTVGPYNLPDIATFPLATGKCNIAAVPAFAGGWECDQDVDGDTTLNTVDNCPTNPDADVDNGDKDDDPLTGIDWQLDSDADTVGDVCDPAPIAKGDGWGYAIDEYPHGFPGEPGGYGDHDRICNDEFTVPGTEGTGDAVCVQMVDTGNDGDPDFLDQDGDTVYDVGEPIDADSDADGDGYTDGCEAVGGSDPLDPSSVPAGWRPDDCDSDGVSDEDEEVLGSDLFAPPLCSDRDGDSSCADPVNDSDDDGCTATEEASGAQPPKPGQYTGFSDSVWYDLFDVKAPVRSDGAGANRPRNKVVDIQDALAVLFYFGANKGQVENGNGVSYDTVKGVDLDGDTDNDVTLHPEIPEGLIYDRSPGAGMTAGPPNHYIDIADALVSLKQFGLDCSGPP